MNEPDRAQSPWGEPASPAGASYRSLAVGPPTPQPAGRSSGSTRTMPSPASAGPDAGKGANPASPAGRAQPAGTQKPPKAQKLPKDQKPFKDQKPTKANRRPVVVERTIRVRIIPRTGVFARLRAAVALTVIAIVIGFGIAAALSVIVWAVATAIHHAAAS